MFSFEQVPQFPTRNSNIHILPDVFRVVNPDRECPVIEVRVSIHGTEPRFRDEDTVNRLPPGVLPSPLSALLRHSREGGNPYGSSGTKKAPDDERPARCLLFSEIVEDLVLRLLLLHHQGFDDVVDLEVIEVLQAHTALVTLEDFLCVFLEAL